MIVHIILLVVCRCVVRTFTYYVISKSRQNPRHWKRVPKRKFHHIVTRIRSHSYYHRSCDTFGNLTPPRTPPRLRLCGRLHHVHSLFYACSESTAPLLHSTAPSASKFPRSWFRAISRCCCNRQCHSKRTGIKLLSRQHNRSPRLLRLPRWPACPAARAESIQPGYTKLHLSAHRTAFRCRQNCVTGPGTTKTSYCLCTAAGKGLARR